jgi:hypothetical protein
MRAVWLLLLLARGRSMESAFFEGDILFKEEFAGDRPPGNVLKDPTLKWPRGIVQYAFDANSRFTDKEKRIVRVSMDKIEEKTGCIEFLQVR